MILKALDTIHISSVSPNNLLTGQTFALDDHFARLLIERGLAAEVTGIGVADEPISRKVAGANTRTKAG